MSKMILNSPILNIDGADGMENTNYKWTIFFADLNPVKGSEQRGRRPVLVISDEVFNRVMPIVTFLFSSMAFLSVSGYHHRNRSD